MVSCCSRYLISTRFQHSTRLHRPPVTETLTRCQFLLVYRFPCLKATIAKDLKFEHKVNIGVGNKYKFHNLPRNDLELEMCSSLPVESLLEKMFS